MDNQHEELLNLILGVLRSWNDPLIHLASEVQRIKEAPDTILWKAVEIEEQNKRLLEGMEKIVGRVSVRSLQSLQSIDVKKPCAVTGSLYLEEKREQYTRRGGGGGGEGEREIR